MKYLFQMKNYMQGLWLSAIVLALVLTFSMYVVTGAFGQILFTWERYTVLEEADTEDGYFIIDDSFAATTGKLSTSQDRLYSKLKEMSGVEAIYRFYGATFINQSLIFLEEGMIERFPTWKEAGMDFGEEKDGVILGDPRHSDVGLDQDLLLDVPLTKEEIKVEVPVAGRLQLPCWIWDPSGFGTKITADGILNYADAVYMLATEENMEKISEYVKVQPSGQYLMYLEPGLDEKSKQEIFDTINKVTYYSPLQEILDRTAEGVSGILKELIAKNIFLIMIALFALFCTMLLTFKKKEREVAVYRLCGGSKRRCALINLGVYALIGLIPTVLNIILVITKYRENRMEGVYVEQTVMDEKAVLFILVYYAVMLLIAVLITVGALAKHTPLTYMRGAER